METRRGKSTKVPVTPRGSPASSTTPETWSRFEDCCAAVARDPSLDGVGFVFSAQDHYVGIDLDKCIVDGTPLPWAQEIVERIGSYTEISQSGLGLHIIAKAECEPFAGRKRDQVEIYSRARYFCTTGSVLEHREQIETRTTEIAKLIEDLFPDEASRIVREIDIPVGPVTLPVAKFSALLINDREFQRLWNRERRPKSDSSMSGYDLALCSIAARAGWSDEELVALIRENRSAHGGPADIEKASRASYLKPTMAKIRSAIDLGCSIEDLGSIESLESSRDSSQEDQLAAICAQMKIHVDGFVIRGDNPATYYVRANGKEIEIGRTGAFLSQVRFREALHTATGRTMASLKAPVWHRLTERITAIAERQEMGDAERIVETMSILRTFLDETGVEPENRWQVAVCESRPFLREGRLHVAAGEMGRVLWVTQGVAWDRGELRRRLREIGFAPIKISARVDERVVTRWYWHGRIESEGG